MLCATKADLPELMMKKTIALVSLGLGLTFSIPSLPAMAQLRQITVNPQSNALGMDEQIWGSPDSPGDKEALLRSIDHSLRYLSTPGAARSYQRYPVRGVTLSRVQRSLRRFRELVVTSQSPAELQAAIEREFVFYKSVGRSSDGKVYFTAYYEPIYAASRTPSAEYRYPLYRKPSNFSSWRKPHPSRAELEGRDGTGRGGRLAGNELVWLRDRFEAFLVHIQGSARLELPDGSVMTVGYGGNTDYPYNSVGREMIKDGLHPSDGFTLPKMIEIFQQRPELLDVYLPRNNRFIFFQETNGAPATGSLNVPVTADRSIATDKSQMPPGALALVRTQIPYFNQEGELEYRLVSRYVLDQDTGSAIKSPGRVDLFLGTGPEAGARAGVVGGLGDLYYPLLRN